MLTEENKIIRDGLTKIAALCAFNGDCDICPFQDDFDKVCYLSEQPSKWNTSGIARGLEQSQACERCPSEKIRKCHQKWCEEYC